MRTFTEKIFYMRFTFLSLALCFCFLGCQEHTNQKKSNPSEIDTISTARAIANAYGIEHWDKVEALTFTFNIDRGSNHFERSFIWHPKTGDVLYQSATDTVAYNRNNSLDSLQTYADKRFINDKYWLLSPFQLVWDQNLTFSEERNAIAPLSKKPMLKLTAVYPNEGGYTPGDAYDFYYSDDYTIHEWVFREGNQETPSIMTTFEDVIELNDIKFTRSHKDSTGGFHLYFSNLTIQ